MQSMIKRLYDLSKRTEKAADKTKILRSQEIEMCRQKLIGRCFRLKAKEPSLVNEEYWKYIYFTRLVMDKGCTNLYYLVASVVDLCCIEDAQDIGIWIREESDSLDEWLDGWLCDAEETTLDDFRGAQKRAFQYICDAMDKY